MKKMITVIKQPGFEGRYWMTQILDGIREVTVRRKDCVLIDELENVSHEVRGRRVLLIGYKVDWLEKALSRLDEYGANPIIVSSCLPPENLGFYNAVVFDLESVLRRMLSSLSDARHIKIALLGIGTSCADRLKLKCFLDFSRDHSESDIFRVEGQLEDAVEDFVACFKERGYDSVICSNDTVAVHLIHCLRQHGYSVPEDIYVVGISDTYLGAYVTPALTTISFDYKSLGIEAVNLCNILYSKGNDCRMTVFLPCEAVIRDSAPLKLAGKLSLRNELVHGYSEEEYVSGELISRILRAESILQESDPVDRNIILELAKGIRCEDVAEKLFLTDRAVRYRLKKIINRHGFATRSELLDLFRSVML